MSVNVQFSSKETGKIVPLHEADEQICSHFQTDCHPSQWYKDWYFSIGLLLAVGLRGEELRNQIRSGWDNTPDRLYELMEILEFIESTYEIKSWRENGG